MKDGFAQKDKKETKGRLECGRMVNIENHENRFADMERGWNVVGERKCRYIGNAVCIVLGCPFLIHAGRNGKRHGPKWGGNPFDE